MLRNKLCEITKVQVVKTSSPETVKLLHRVEGAVSDADDADADGIICSLDDGAFVTFKVAHITISYDDEDNMLSYVLFFVCFGDIDTLHDAWTNCSRASECYLRNLLPINLTHFFHAVYVLIRILGILKADHALVSRHRAAEAIHRVNTIIIKVVKDRRECF